MASTVNKKVVEMQFTPAVVLQISAALKSIYTKETLGFAETPSASKNSEVSLFPSSNETCPVHGHKCVAEYQKAQYA